MRLAQGLCAGRLRALRQRDLWVRAATAKCLKSTSPAAASAISPAAPTLPVPAMPAALRDIFGQVGAEAALKLSLARHPERA